MKRFLYAGALVLAPLCVWAQAPEGTSAGSEVSVNLSHYNYVEPGGLAISIHGPKLGAEYTGTAVLSGRRHWFAQANVGGTIGYAIYDGWCSPWFIKPNSSSPNGYELDIGSASACGETGDRDWYLEGRALVGKDFISRKWTLSPYAGAGVRHLSNGTTGNPGFRTDTYLYPPVGLVMRTGSSSHPLSVMLEYDQLMHGRQITRNSKLGGGEIPATPTAPVFTIDGISDVSFVQHGGWAARASAKYHVTRHWWVEPYFIHWSVNASPANDETVTFTVNQVPAHEQLGFYEPFNTTNELGVKVGLRF